MPITPTSDHKEGYYPDTIRHVSNGDPANQVTFQNPSKDLEYRTEVLRLFVNNVEATSNIQFAQLEVFDRNHNHSGGSNEAVLDFAQIYSNSSQTNAYFSLAAGSSFGVRRHASTETLLFLKEDGATDADKIKFPGSDMIFAHVSSNASDLNIKPHGLKLSARIYKLSDGCYVDGAGNHVSSIILDPSKSVGQKYAAPGLLGLTASTGDTEGVVVGDNLVSSGDHDNIILVRSQNIDPITVGGSVVYGLLGNTGILGSPVWELRFYCNGAPYTFNSNVTLILYGQRAYSLSSIPLVDPAFAILCRDNKVI